MKTAEEWFNNYTHEENEILSNLLSKDEAIEFIKQIQLDAWRQGMTDAALIAYNFTGNASCQAEILIAKDNIKER